MAYPDMTGEAETTLEVSATLQTFAAQMTGEAETTIEMSAVLAQANFTFMSGEAESGIEMGILLTHVGTPFMSGEASSNYEMSATLQAQYAGILPRGVIAHGSSPVVNIH